MMRRSRLPVVVGVAADIGPAGPPDLDREWDRLAPSHGSGSGDASGLALEWAAVEAAAQLRPLRIVHAIPLRVPLDLYGMAVPGWQPPLDLPSGAASVSDLPAQSPDTIRDDLHAHAKRTLRIAEERARRLAPELRITAHAAFAMPALLLREQSQDAHLIVVGRHQPDTLVVLRRALNGSVSAQLATSAHCPVVVTPDQGRPSTSRADRRSPRIVVEAGQLPLDEQTMSFAFQAARQRRLPLSVIHVTPPVPTFTGLTPPPPRPLSDPRVELGRALHPWHDHHPDIDLRTVVVSGERAATLTAHAKDAALLILSATPSPGRRGHPGPRPRDIRRLLRHVGGPVAITHGAVQPHNVSQN
jgi:nucleotide-binding universal stress UspA family protein